MLYNDIVEEDQRTPCSGLFCCTHLDIPAVDETQTAAGLPRGKGDTMSIRPDRDGAHRVQFDKNKQKIYATQTVCGICGKPVDMSIRYPHPLSKCIDHIIPVAKGGHPSDINNLQLAHRTCNRQKSDKILDENMPKVTSGDGGLVSNRLLPQSMDWTQYSG